MNFLLTVILFGIAIYVLYSAITGKGKLFVADNIKEEKIESFKKILKKLYLGMGIVMLVMALISGLQNLIYNGYGCEFTDDFAVYYADSIEEDGTIVVEGLDGEYHVDGIYTTSTMASIFNALPSPEIEAEEGKTVYFYQYALHEDGETPYFLGLGETEPNQNGFYTELRSIFSHKLLQILSGVMMGIAVIAIVFLFILIRKYTDKEKQEKSRAQAEGRAMPSSAFNFDEEA